MVESPADVRDRVCARVVVAFDEAPQVVGAGPAADLRHHAVADVEGDALASELAQREDDVVRLHHHPAIHAAFGRQGREEAPRPVVPASRLRGEAVFCQDELVAERIGDVGARVVGEAQLLRRLQPSLAGLDSRAHLGGGKQALQDLHRLDDEQDAGACLLHRDLLVGEEQEHVVDHHVGVLAGLHRLRVLAERVLPDVGDPDRRVLGAVRGEVHVGHVGAEVARRRERRLPVAPELIAFREDGDRLPRPHLAELEIIPEHLRQSCLILLCAHESGSYSAALTSAV